LEGSTCSGVVTGLCLVSRSPRTSLLRRRRSSGHLARTDPISLADCAMPGAQLARTEMHLHPSRSCWSDGSAMFTTVASKMIMIWAAR
jgi:hypothetical protein